ncbi:MAG: hypothetical protein IAG13_18590, partial [Deltaproteobacteria bacterium]|nr:hypothetical protein [Nannocystaceae bacterium]
MHHRLSLSSALLLLVVACRSDSNGNASAEGDTSGGIDTLDGGTSSDSTTVVAESSSSSSSSGGDGGVCETVLCGDPAACCADDEDCAAGACVPACESGVRCGGDASVCCDDGQVCVSDACVTPTGSCVDSFDCEIGEFCEPTLGECLPQFDPVTCAYDPNFEAIEVVQEWAHTDDQSISSPMIADLDADGVPEVVVITTADDGSDYVAGDLLVLDGATGLPKWRIDHGVDGAVGPHGRSTVGIADIDGDDAPDIVYAGRPSGGRSVIQAYDGAGNLLWASHDADG